MPVTTLLLVAAVALVASGVHSAVGFGSGPLLVPVLLLLVDPATAVFAAIAVGMEVNLLQIAGERRRPRVPFSRVLPVWLAAPPGALAGALVAGRLDRDTLSLVVAGALLLSAVAALAAPPRLPKAALAAGGVLAGLSAALTGVFGPVLGLLLLAAGCRGDHLRDGVGASFLVIGTCAIAASVSVGASVPAPELAATLTVAAAAGHAIGRRAATRLSDRAQRASVVATVAVGSVIALAASVA